MWWGVPPTSGERMVARYLAILYVTELMLLTIGLRGGALFVNFWQPVYARDSIAWVEFVIQGSVDDLFFFQLLCLFEISHDLDD